MTLLSNTTQVPHIIIREWMPLLKDIELRILLIVTDQTLGWIEDPETKRRKEKDWISHYQLRTRVKRRGAKPCGDRSVSMAIAVLVDDLGIVEALDEEGNKLNSPDKRMRNGGKIYYRLNLKAPQKSLFDTPAQTTGGKYHTFGLPQPPHKRTPAKSTSYKRNLLYKKENHVNGTTVHSEKDQKRKQDHMSFMDYWHKMVPKTRNVESRISGMDGKNLKRVLESGVNLETLEKISLFFLADGDFAKFSPTISTLLSAGILTGLLNRLQNDKTFWKKLDQYSWAYFKTTPTPPKMTADRGYGVASSHYSSIASALTTMLKSLHIT